MGYSGSQPPDSVIWMKDGLLYQGDGVRVQTTHEGITFRRVLPEDAGRYTVTAQNREGTGQAYSVLRGLFTHFLTCDSVMSWNSYPSVQCHIHLQCLAFV